MRTPAQQQGAAVAGTARGAGLLLLAAGMMVSAGCGTPPKPVRQDPELERHTSLAQRAFAAGSPEKASAYYRKALDRARLMDAPAAIGRNAYNLAACLVLLRQDLAAGALLDEADTEFQRAGVSAPEIPLLKARIARRAGRPDDALALLQEPLKIFKAGQPFFIQYQVLQADLLCAKGEATNAAAALARVRPGDLAAAEPAVQAEADQVRARLALLDRQPRDAAGFQDAAAGHFQQAGRYLEMAQALEEAGKGYEAAGAWDVALNRYYRAIRSLYLAGRTAAADGLMARALVLADQAGTPAMRTKLKQLQADLRPAPAAADAP